jgi:hypothetical protein
MFKRAFRDIVLLWVTSFYLFPLIFTFLPESVNSKMIVATFGVAMFFYDCVQKRSFELSRTTIGATLLASVFSVWCL